MRFYLAVRFFFKEFFKENKRKIVISYQMNDIFNFNTIKKVFFNIFVDLYVQIHKLI